MLPDSLSPPASCYQHGAEWLLLPGRQKPSTCPLAAGRVSEGSDASPGNASPEEPWEEKSTSMADNCLQRSKSFFKTSLSLFTNSRLRLSEAGCSTRAWPRKLQRSSTDCRLSLPGGSGGSANVTLTQSIREPERICSENHHPLDISQRLATLRGVGTLSVSACCWDTLWWDAHSICCGNERKTSCFHRSTMAFYSLQRPLGWNSPSLHLNTLGKATLNLAGYGLTFIKKYFVPHPVCDLVTQTHTLECSQCWQSRSKKINLAQTC